MQNIRVSLFKTVLVILFWCSFIQGLILPFAQAEGVMNFPQIAFPHQPLSFWQRATHLLNGKTKETTLVPVQVQVQTGTPDWTSAIFICNNSLYPIPLHNLQFTFHTLPSQLTILKNGFWGDPWLDWRIASIEGDQVVLTGGSDWMADLQPDPQCEHKLSIQFSFYPTFSPPTGPFELQAAGGHPIGNGTLKVVMPAVPAIGIPNPVVKVTGMGITQEQTVTWGQSWTLSSLVTGSYTISAASVNNGSLFFRPSEISQTVTVNDQQTATVNVNYVNVPAIPVTITFTEPPVASQSLNLVGKYFNFQPQVSTQGGTITLPSDVYTAASPQRGGYTVVVTPNPFTVPTTSHLTVSYQQVTPTNTPRFVGYFQSWSSAWASDGQQTDLANLPSYVNVVPIAFMRPDAQYVKGSLDYSQTGLEFSYQHKMVRGVVLQQAIAALHKNHPDTKILVAVGGASYTNWAGLNPQAIADFVNDMGLDGVDIDYEPADPGCSKGSDELIHCSIDEAFQSYVSTMRTFLPIPHWVTVAGWSIGAYGEGQWVNAQPQGQYTGVMLPLLRSAAAKDIDMINVMSYDAGTTYDAATAAMAYANYFNGPLSMGVEVPPEAWGGNVSTIADAQQLTSKIVALSSERHLPPGMMLWSLHKQPNGTPSATNPSAQMFATAICTGLGLENCNDPLINK